jgi:hypothetical protein
MPLFLCKNLKEVLKTLIYPVQVQCLTTPPIFLIDIRTKISKAMVYQPSQEKTDE